MTRKADIAVQRRFKGGTPHPYGTPEMDYEVEGSAIPLASNKVGSKPSGKVSNSSDIDDCCAYPDDLWTNQFAPCLHDCHFPPLTAKEMLDERA